MKFKSFYLYLFVLPLIWGALLAEDNTASNVTNYSPSVNTELWVINLVPYGTMTAASCY